MPKYLIERQIPGAGKMTPAQLQVISQKSCGVLSELGSQIQWQHSYVTGDAIHCDGTGTLLVSTVTGTGSTGAGCSVDNGANVNPAGTNTVTGTGGQVKLAGSAFNWSDAPQVSSAKLARFGAA